MQGIPFDIFKFRDLVTLQLDNNRIRRIPFAIRKMPSLRHLSVSSNQLESLPSVLEMIRLDTIDISGNNFNASLATTTEEMNNNNQEVVSLSFPSLFEIAARFVELKRCANWDFINIYILLSLTWSIY